MKIGFEMEIGPVAAVARGGRTLAIVEAGFEVLPSNMMGNIMFGSLVKPNQGESNQIKPAENICSGES